MSKNGRALLSKLKNTTLIDQCPVCGEKQLQAVVDVPLHLNIENVDAQVCGTGGKTGIVQVWAKAAVLDEDIGYPLEIRCAACKSYWERGNFTLDDYGWLIGLGEVSK